MRITKNAKKEILTEVFHAYTCIRVFSDLLNVQNLLNFENTMPGLLSVKTLSAQQGLKKSGVYTIVFEKIRLSISTLK